jgi:hypothetical protein
MLERIAALESVLKTSSATATRAFRIGAVFVEDVPGDLGCIGTRTARSRMPADVGV